MIGSYYQELNTTEGILSELSIMLTNYHDKLKEVSKQVKIMQDKSETYRIKLANRKELVEEIINFLKKRYTKYENYKISM